MDIIDTDILVVGAGPTGLVLSNILGAYGIECILVEKNPSTGKEPRAVSVDDESLRTLQAIGVTESFLPLVSKNYGSHYLSPAGKTFAIVEPQLKTYGYYKRNGFDQPELENILFKNLQKYNCVKIYFNSTLTEIINKKKSIISHISRKRIPISIQSKYVIACDGGSSAIRKKIGINLKGLNFNERWLIIDLFETGNKFRHTQVHCDSKRPCITLPGPKGIRRYEFKLQEDECENGYCSKAFLSELLSGKGYENNASVRRKCVYTFNALVADKWSQGNIFLAGDAAHLSPPFAGQGMNSGIRDAHNLGWKLAYAIKYSNPNILKSYEIERKIHVWQMINISILMGKILAPKNIFSAFFTRVMFFILSLYTPAWAYVSQMKFKPQPYFSSGLIWKSYDKKNNKMVGRLFPQPVVEDVNGNQFLLDNLFNNESVILIFSETPEKSIKRDVITKFRKKGVLIIGVTPEWMNPVLADFPIVRDVSRLLSDKNFINYIDKAFFIRPDRYIASISALNSFETFFRITKTFQNKA